MARAAYGLYFGPKHPWNEGYPLEGLYQGSDRAELRAIVRALEAHKNGELHIASDNQPAVDTTTDLALWAEGHAQTPKIRTDRDLWKRVIVQIMRN